MDSPPFVVVNYTQDLSQEGALKRLRAGRPKGIAEDRPYRVYYVYNIPGSVYSGIGVYDPNNSRYRAFFVKKFIEAWKESGDEFLIEDNFSSIVSGRANAKNDLVPTAAKFDHEGTTYSVNPNDCYANKGTIVKSELKWFVPENTNKAIIFANDKNDASRQILMLGGFSQTDLNALLDELGNYTSLKEEINSHIIDKIKNTDREELIAWSTYTTLDLLAGFGTQDRLAYLKTVTAGRIDRAAELVVLKWMRTFESTSDIQQLLSTLESDQYENKPLIIHLINEYADIDVAELLFPGDENEKSFQSQLLSQWGKLYESQLPEDSEITRYDATYPASRGTQRYSWHTYHLSRNPAQVEFKIGHQARDKEPTYVGEPQTYNLLTGTTKFYLLDEGDIVFMPALYGYMQTSWKNAQIYEDIIDAALVELATYGVGKFIKAIQSLRYLDEAVDVVRVASKADDLIRGVKKSTFKSSFEATDEIAEEAWEYFKNEEWSKLENLFTTRKLNDGWPPNSGFINIRVEKVPVGTRLDRYGGYIDDAGDLKDGGKFLANNGEELTNRALPAGSDKKYYSQYEVIKEIPEVKKGEAIPWFGERGKGIQYETKSVDYLLSNEFIKRITVKDGNGVLIPIGRGSTGRTVAENLTEQLAMKEIRSNPRVGQIIQAMKPLTDSRWSGWRKMQFEHVGTDGNKVVIHYNGNWVDGILKAVDDFKFK